MECLTTAGASRVLLRFGRRLSKSPPHGRSLLLLRRRFSTVVAAQDSGNNDQQQLNLSVLRFTLGIPGLDESYLPRWIGVACGSLVLLNHVLSPSPTPAQLRSEVLGLSLAAFSTTLPYLGRFLKGVNPVDRSPVPEGNKQVFIMSENLSVSQKEDLAWGSYVLLRNTNTMSVLIAVQDALCVRGYWNTPRDVSKAQILESFQSWIKQVGFLDLNDTLYFPQSTAPATSVAGSSSAHRQKQTLGGDRLDSELQRMLPKGAVSLLVQPVIGAPDPITDVTTKIEGFVLLASSANYAYSDRDRAWIRAVANKFQGMNTFSDFQLIGTSR